MRIFCAVLLLTFLVFGQSFSDLNEQWDEWKNKYEKVYDNQAEMIYRKMVWEENMKTVLKHNQEASAGQHSFTMGANHLSDMTAEEVNEMLNGLKVEDPTPFTNWTFNEVNDMPIPRSVDWRKRGMVSPVQNQGKCGSCWAFSAVGALEGQLKRRTGVLVPLSPQNLVDCSTKNGNHGCKGGYITKALKYIIYNKGIDSAKSYPYKYKQGKCRYSIKGKAGYCSGVKVIAKKDEKLLKRVVAKVGPVSVSINANLPSFHQYKRGVYNAADCKSKSTNHAVLLVGYGRDKGKDFWLVKNSWGTAWGEKGYIRMARNKKNLCGIASFAVYPTL
ncbi:cathepsin S, ortholog 1 [Polymixia lowei]